jgi:hypothetical protein
MRLSRQLGPDSVIYNYAWAVETRQWVEDDRPLTMETVGTLERNMTAVCAARNSFKLKAQYTAL